MATNSGTRFSYFLGFDDSSEDLSKKKDVFVSCDPRKGQDVRAYHSLLLELMEPLTCS
jgi:hypothetical protein